MSKAQAKQPAPELPYWAVHNPDFYRQCEEDIEDELSLACEEHAYGYGDFND